MNLLLLQYIKYFSRIIEQCMHIKEHYRNRTTHILYILIEKHFNI